VASFSQGALIQQCETITTSSGPYILDIGSKTYLRFTGAIGQVNLPDASSLKKGRYFVIQNQSTGDISVNNFNGTPLANISPSSERKFFLYDKTTTSGDWFIPQVGVSKSLSMHATRANADGYLHFESNKIVNTDGSTDSIPPYDFTLKTYSGSYINFLSSSEFGGTFGGTILTNGEAFKRPNVSADDYVRMVATYRSDINAIDTRFSPAIPSGANPDFDLEDAGLTVSYLKGIPVGDIVLKSLGGFNFKTYGADSDVIKNDRITNYTTSGGIVANLKDFTAINVSGNTLTIAGGYLALSDGRILVTYDGSGNVLNDYAANITYDTSSISDSVNYYLYIDLASLSTAPIIPTDTAIEAYIVTGSNLVHLTTPPEFINANRYVFITSIYKKLSEAATYVNNPSKLHSIALGADASLEYSRDYTTIGNIGDVDQTFAGHNLSSSSFYSSYLASTSWYNLTSASDNSALGNTLSLVGDAIVLGVGILGVADSCITLNGTNQYLMSDDLFFTTGNSFTVGGWFNCDFTNQTFFSHWELADKSWKLECVAGSLTLTCTSDGATEEVVSYSDILASGWHHLVVSYDSTTTKFIVNIDYKNTITHTLTAPLYPMSSGFKIGYSPVTNVFYSGRVDEVFYSKDFCFEDGDKHTIFCSKLAHSRTLTPESQRWDFWISNGHQEYPIYGVVVNTDLNNVWFDLTAYPSTYSVAVKLFNGHQTGYSKPAKARTLEILTEDLDGILPLSHNLGVVPELSFKLKNIDGDYEYLNHGDYFVSNTTQVKLKTSVPSLVGILGSDKTVILTYATSNLSQYVPDRAWTTHSVNSDSLVYVNDKALVDTQAAPITLTLPSSPISGDSLIVVDAKSSFDINSCILARNGKNIRGNAEDFECNIGSKMYTLVYIDDIVGWSIYF